MLKPCSNFQVVIFSWIKAAPNKYPSLSHKKAKAKTNTHGSLICETGNFIGMATSALTDAPIQRRYDIWHLSVPFSYCA